MDLHFKSRAIQMKLQCTADPQLFCQKNALWNGLNTSSDVRFRRSYGVLQMYSFFSEKMLWKVGITLQITCDSNEVTMYCRLAHLCLSQKYYKKNPRKSLPTIHWCTFTCSKIRLHYSACFTSCSSTQFIELVNLLIISRPRVCCYQPRTWTFANKISCRMIL